MEYKGVEIYQTPGEVAILRRCVQETANVPGDIVEVGVFQGASALIIREESQKTLYLFDTFEGFPDRLHPSDASHYVVGLCAAPEEKARRLLADSKNIIITKGIFPDTAGVIKNKKFSFAHIDVDIYSATKDSLEFLYPRMSERGIILVHDYPAHRGVKLAVDEFMVGKKAEQILGDGGGRQLIIKT